MTLAIAGAAAFWACAASAREVVGRVRPHRDTHHRGPPDPVPSKYVNPAMPQGSLVSVSQLYMTAVVQDESGVKTFPAIYMWNQSTDTLNTTPAWEAFQLPPVE